MEPLEALSAHLKQIVLQYGHHPGMSREEAAYFYIGPAEEVAAGVWHFYNLANAITFVCGNRLMQVDCNIGFKASEVIDEIRGKTDLPFDTIAITHGHVDHCMGTHHYVRDNVKRGYARPRVIGHRNLRDRIDKNKRLEGHRIGTDKRQFQVEFEQRDVFVYPDVEFYDRMETRIEDQSFLIAFGHGHTEDSIWIYNRERRVLCCGDLFQWTAPNLGNPFKMQRFARENALALEEMASLEAEVLCPGHGPVIHGRKEIENCLLTAARYLHHIENHVVDCLNQGILLEETLARLEMPEELLRSKWLPPVYGHPVFIAQGVYKRYAGYYSGNPAELFPPPYAAKAAAVLSMAGGADRVIEQAERTREKGDLSLACQLAEWVVRAEPENRAGWETYGMLFKQRAETEQNMQARGCWNSAVRQAVARIKSLG